MVVRRQQVSLFIFSSGAAAVNQEYHFCELRKQKRHSQRLRRGVCTITGSKSHLTSRRGSKLLARFSRSRMRLINQPECGGHRYGLKQNCPCIKLSCHPQPRGALHQSSPTLAKLSAINIRQSLTPLRLFYF